MIAWSPEKGWHELHGDAAAGAQASTVARLTAGATLAALVDAYNATGRIAVLHPRKRTVSLDGFPPVGYAAARVKMARVLGL